MSLRDTNRRKWAALRTEILERAGYRCERCGRAGRLEADHKLALRHGGTDDKDNLQALCRTCHIEKTRRERRTVNWSRDGIDEWNRLVDDLTITLPT